MSTAKPKLLYIASNGRSGSTLLELLLNVSPHLWTLGEFHVLPWEIRENAMPCGCGRQVMECELWCPIIAEHRELLLHGSIDRFRRTYKTDRTLRFAELPFLLTGRMHADRTKSDAIQRYAMDNRTVLESVRCRAKALGKTSLEWLVDSSKSPYRLLWLAASGEFDLKVIHLVKDPRAFAYSLAKHSSGLSQTYQVARAAARWQVENRLFGALSGRFLCHNQVLRLRYEDLAARTDEILREVADWLQVPVWSRATESFRETNHGICGNTSRFESRRIELDEKWKRELPLSLQRLAFRCGWQLVSRYGYQSI